VKINFSIADAMGSKNLSVTTSPFAPGKTIIKRASFPKGEVPAHLEGYTINKGECKGRTGVVVGPRGNPIPNTAACIAEKHKGRGRGRKRAVPTE
jgi:hypothetical protein